MTSIRGCSLGLSAMALLLIPALPVEAQPFSCIATASIPPLLRADGRTELVGDMVLTCSGGTPTRPGQPVPQYNVQIFLNTNITSRLLTGPWSEALLLVDDPPPATQLVCGAPTAPVALPGVCAITGSGTGLGLYDGTPGHPNIFQGQSAGSNSVLFSSVPVDPPASGALRIIRITNVRADAFALGVSPGTPPIAVTMAVVSTFPINFVFSPPMVGFSATESQFSVPAAPILQQCISQNASLATDPMSNGSPQFQVNFNEGLATAFKARSAAPIVNFDQPPPLVDQNLPGQVLPTATETGFFNHLFPNIAGQGNLALTGLATQSTRLMARFIDVPAGVQLFTNTTITLTLTSGGPTILNPVIRLVQTGQFGGGPFSATPGNSFGIAPLAGSGSTRTAVFEVMRNDPSSFEQASIPIYVAYNANAPAAPGMGTVLVAGGFAPLTTDNLASATDSIPRFAPPTTALPAFTIASCQAQCGMDVSAQTTVARGQINFSQALKLWVQFVSIQNTSANPIPGPLSLALDSISSTAVLANPTGFTRCDAPAGHPYLNSTLGAGTTLAPGQKAFVALAFSAASAQAIGYSTRVLAGAGNR